MSGRRVAILLGFLGLLASQAGHLLAYQLRFGSAAPALQSAGQHAYFPAVAKTGLGLLGVAMVAGLLVVAVARVIAGGRLEKDSAPAYLRLLAGLFTFQLSIFAIQETLEATTSGAQAGSAAALVLWGTAGQLPVAALAAFAARWMLARLRPALARIAARVEVAVRPVILAPAWVRPMPYAVALEVDNLAFTFTRRGPPL